MRSNKRNTIHTEVKEYLISMIGNAPYGLIAIDLEGIVTIANTLAAQYLDVPSGNGRRQTNPEDLVDRPLLPFLSALSPLEETIADCLEKGRKPFDLEQVPFKSRHFNIRGRIILNGLLISIEEVTRQVEAEQALKIQAGQLAASNKELEEFAWLSSHDMKSPIISLDGLMSMMEKNKAVRPGFEHIFQMAMNSTRQMRKTIMALNEIIAFRKTLQIEKEKVALGEIWEEIKTAIQQSIVASGAIIQADFSGCPVVWYPPVHLKSILQNLLTNAIKYTRKGKAPVIHVRSFTEGKSPVIEFTDEGIGIDLKLHRQKLFGIFQRFHTHTEGMGIGLHMIHSIVRSYNGRIQVKSKINEGTTFKIYLSDEKVQ
jgi:signal transduction histidine kinase